MNTLLTNNEIVSLNNSYTSIYSKYKLSTLIKHNFARIDKT